MRSVRREEMAIEEYMTASPITVRSTDSVWYALKILRSNEIRHLPVIQGKRLVGIITDRDFRLLLPSSLAMPEDQARFRAWGAQVKVGEVMNRKVMTVTPETRTDKAARLMVEHRIGCLPVVRGSTLVGILTTNDLLQALAAEDQPRVVATKRTSSRRWKQEDRRTPRAEDKKVRRS
jgi:acetoin utilization protein AcuB